MNREAENHNIKPDNASKQAGLSAHRSSKLHNHTVWFLLQSNKFEERHAV